MERSVVLVKPDGMQRGIIGEIIHRFERKGLRLVGLKMAVLTDAVLEDWYKHHKDKPFFPGLKSYMQTTPITAMLWEGGTGTCSAIRKIVGVTKASEAEPGTIRGDFAMSVQYNLIHASESVEAGQREESLMFKPEEVFSWDKSELQHVFEARDLA